MSAGEPVRPGVRVGVDLGTVRVGVAVSDPAGVLATPFAVLPRAGSARRLGALVADRDCLEVIVGRPRSLSGRIGAAERAAGAYASTLAAVLSCPVRLVDERLSTVAATAALAAGGTRGRAARARVDAAAAAVILQTALDSERATGLPPGEVVPGGS